MLQSDFTKVKDFCIPQIRNNMIDIMALRVLTILHLQIKKKKLYGPLFLWMGFNCLKAKATLRRQFTFYH